MTSEKNIQIADIDRELKELWELNKAQKKIKACLFNLIIYTQKEYRAEYFKSFILAIIEKFPCRIIFIERDMTEGDEYLRVTVSNETYTRDGSTIACDEITIKVAGTPIERVPYIISPHLVPDLPLYLLWGQDPTRDKEILPNFEKLAGRLIFDKECSDNLQEFCEAMLKRIASSEMEIMDINWALIGPWRDVISQVFSSKDEIRQINRAKKVTIHYNSTKSAYFIHNETQAIYLQSWLGAQLKWKVEDIRRVDNKITLFYTTDVGPLEIHLEPKEQPSLRYGAIIELTVETVDNNTVTVCRQHSLNKVIVHITKADQCFLPFSLPLPNLKRGFNLLRELFYESTSTHYQNMLKILALTNWKKIY